VDNMVLVAVVYAPKDLLHENCCVFLSEFAFGDDLVKKLSSLANSDNGYFRISYSVTM
jgi:hypothetical protein